MDLCRCSTLWEEGVSADYAVGAGGVQGMNTYAVWDEHVCCIAPEGVKNVDNICAVEISKPPLQSATAHYNITYIATT